jgi:hypothetical protein
MNSGTFEIPLPRYTFSGVTFAAAALALLLLAPLLPPRAATPGVQTAGLTRDDRGQLSRAGAARVVTAVEGAQAALEEQGTVRPEQCALAQRQLLRSLPSLEGDARMALLHAHDQLKQLGCD